MKEDELRENATCTKCHKLIGPGGPMFWSGSVKYYMMDFKALQRQAGLTAMLGGSAQLARVMGTNEDLAIEMGRARITICGACASEFISFIAIEEEDEDEQKA